MERDFRPNRSFTAPVRVGDELEVKIDAVGEKGDGIAKKGKSEQKDEKPPARKENLDSSDHAHL